MPPDDNAQRVEFRFYDRWGVKMGMTVSMTAAELSSLIIRAQRDHVREAQEKAKREAEEQKRAWEDLNEKLSGTWRLFEKMFPEPSEYGQEAPKQEAPRVKPKGSYLEQLCVFAKVDFPTTLEPKVVYRKAMRRCHPDHGGSAEQWHEMEYLGRRLGLSK